MIPFLICNEPIMTNPGRFAVRNNPLFQSTKIRIIKALTATNKENGAK